MIATDVDAEPRIGDFSGQQVRRWMEENVDRAAAGG